MISGGMYCCDSLYKEVRRIGEKEALSLTSETTSRRMLVNFQLKILGGQGPQMGKRTSTRGKKGRGLTDRGPYWGEQCLILGFQGKKKKAT